MSKIAIITDTHFGARSFDEGFAEHFFKFFETILFPYLDKTGIKEVLHLGDLVDNRKVTNLKMLYDVRKRVFKQLQKRGVRLTIIPGNHDVFFKDTNEISAVDLLLEDTTIARIVNTPQVVTIGGHSIALVPWISPDNEAACMDFINTTKCDTIALHAEITSFAFSPGHVCDHGLDPSTFARFKNVWSGHFHLQQTTGNIKYLGTPYEISWTDYGSPKGFHVWDGATLEFIENPYKMHHVIEYDDSKTDYLALDVTPYTGAVVKLKVRKKTNAFTLDTFVGRLDAVAKDNRITVIEESVLGIIEPEVKPEAAGATTTAERIAATPTAVRDTRTLLKDYLDRLPCTQAKEPILGILNECYDEALSKMGASGETV